MKILVPILCLLLTSCVRKSPDITLRPDPYANPDLNSQIGIKDSNVQEWGQFHAYRDASFQVVKRAAWTGVKPVPASSISIRMMEGYRDKRVSAFGKTVNLWVQIPGSASVGDSIELRTAASSRMVTHEGIDPVFDDPREFGLLEDGEVLVSGILGSGILMQRPNRDAIGTLNILEWDASKIVFRMQARIPTWTLQSGVLFRNVLVDRTYEALFRSVDSFDND